MLLSIYTEGIGKQTMSPAAKQQDSICDSAVVQMNVKKL